MDATRKQDAGVLKIVRTDPGVDVWMKPKDYATVKASIHIRNTNKVADAAAIHTMLSGSHVDGIGSSGSGGSPNGGSAGAAGAGRFSQGGDVSDINLSSSTADTEYGLVGTDVEFVLDDGKVMRGVEEALLTMYVYALTVIILFLQHQPALI